MAVGLAICPHAGPAVYIRADAREIIKRRASLTVDATKRCRNVSRQILVGLGDSERPNGKRGEGAELR